MNVYLYDGIIQRIGREMDPLSEKASSHHKYQLGGSCEQQGIQAYMHSILPESLYRRVKADLTSRSIEIFRKEETQWYTEAVLNELLAVHKRRLDKLKG